MSFFKNMRNAVIKKVQEQLDDLMTEENDKKEDPKQAVKPTTEGMRERTDAMRKRMQEERETKRKKMQDEREAYRKHVEEEREAFRKRFEKEREAKRKKILHSGRSEEERNLETDRQTALQKIEATRQQLLDKIESTRNLLQVKMESARQVAKAKEQSAQKRKEEDLAFQQRQEERRLREEERRQRREARHAPRIVSEGRAQQEVFLTAETDERYDYLFEVDVDAACDYRRWAHNVSEKTDEEVDALYKKYLPIFRCLALRHKVSDDGVLSESASQGVETIVEKCFYEMESLKAVVLSADVKTICKDAFYKCESLESIDLSACEHMTVLPQGVFQDLGSLKKVKLPPHLKEIPALCFSGDGQLETIEIPESVTAIGNYAFYSCESLEEIELPPGVASVGEFAFSNCTFTSIELPESLIKVGEDAFCCCEKLRRLEFPDSVQKLGKNVVSGCVKLKSVSLPKSLKKMECLGDHLENLKEVDFSRCKKLKELTEPLFGTSAPKLKSLEIPNGVECVEKDFFEHIYGLPKLYVPPTVTELELPARNGFGDVYIYGEELDSVAEIFEHCDCVYFKEEFVEKFAEQAEAECAESGEYNVIPEEELYFYDD